MEHVTVRLEDFLKEVGFGEVRIRVVNGKLALIPRQVIDRPLKSGVKVQMVVEDPIRLKEE